MIELALEKWEGFSAYPFHSTCTQ